MTLKNDCCEKYKTKGKACKECPVTATLCKKERKKLLRKYKKRHKKRRDASATAQQAA